MPSISLFHTEILLIEKKLFGKALSLELRDYSKCEVLEVSLLLSYIIIQQFLHEEHKKVHIKAKQHWVSLCQSRQEQTNLSL